MGTGVQELQEFRSYRMKELRWFREDGIQNSEVRIQEF
jgi:hypothetical protein